MLVDLSFSTSLLALGRWLQDCGYRFTTPTPATHSRVLARSPDSSAQDLRGAFGWNLPFAVDTTNVAALSLPAHLTEALQATGLLVRTGAGHWRSTVRFGTLGNLLLAHSAFPTDTADSVFFGPDTYRFAALIERVLVQAPLPPRARVLDMDCGSGAGGLVVERFVRTAGAALSDLVLADINPHALVFAKTNASMSGVPERVQSVQSNLFEQVDGMFDLVVSNPPYLIDGTERTYRHGGGALGGGLSERIARESLPYLRPGGRLVLYTGSVLTPSEN